jgi:hypothetical protein
VRPGAACAYAVIRTRRIAYAAFAAVMGAAGSVTVDAPAAAVSCGQVLDESVVLRHDLTDWAGDGLVIGAPTRTGCAVRSMRAFSLPPHSRLTPGE